MQLNQFDSTLYYAKNALQLSEENKYPKGRALAKYLIGKAYLNLSHDTSGMSWIMQARQDYETLGDQYGIANCNLQAGVIAYSEKNYENAITDFDNARMIYDRLDSTLKSSTCEYLTGLCLTELGRYTEAEKNLLHAADTRLKLKNEHKYYECIIGLGQLNLRTGHLQKSKQYFEKCLSYFMKENSEDGITHADFGIAKVFQQMNLPDSAEKYFMEAYSESKQTNNLNLIMEVTQALSSFYERENDFSKAFDFLKIYSQIKDSLVNANKAKAILYLQSNLDLKNKEATIQSQRYDLRLVHIETYLLIGLAALLILLTLLLFNRYRLKQKTNKQLGEANRKLRTTLAELRTTQQQLIQSEKLASIGLLTAGIAHEINNPINFVSANVNPLKRNFRDLKSLLSEVEAIAKKSGHEADFQKMKDNLEIDYNLSETENLLKGIEEGSKRTAEIVKGLRSFSRMEDEEIKRTQINEGIDSTLLLLQNRLKHSNIEVVKQYNKLPDIMCIPGQINQVFMNILNNAIDATENNGKIFITTVPEKDEVKISIRDTGKGMSKEVMQKIFDPFFTTKAVGKGTGLGLSISYSIIEKHHGTIEVTSEPGKGSEFKITLPVSQEK